MPIYEYQCAACGRVVEKWQKFSEPPLTQCPTCGGSLSKIISSCAFHLKGSGWYVTDYAGSRQSGSSPNPADSAGVTEGPKTKETEKSDSSPAPKIK